LELKARVRYRNEAKSRNTGGKEARTDNYRQLQINKGRSEGNQPEHRLPRGQQPARHTPLISREECPSGKNLTVSRMII
ncbi:TPA_asm: hypothetical protein G1Q02_25655, partial [Salmonella enterica subsp. enterica serovar Typhimurium]|nr:hypothetical protein [Salmonella enterica subsp. enterica serovar Typhimurium]